MTEESSTEQRVATATSIGAATLVLTVGLLQFAQGIGTCGYSPTTPVENGPSSAEIQSGAARTTPASHARPS